MSVLCFQLFIKQNILHSKLQSRLNIGANRPPSSMSIKMFASLINNCITALHGTEAAKISQ